MGDFSEAALAARASSPSDTSQPLAVLGLLESATRWTLSSRHWTQVAELLDRLRAAWSVHDLADFGRTHDELRELVTEARRLGHIPPDLETTRMPRPIRQRLNILVHDLGIPEEVPSNVDDGDGFCPVEAAGKPTAPSAAFSPWAGRRFFSLPVFDRGRIALASTNDQLPGEGLSLAVDLDGMHAMLRTVGRSLVEIIFSVHEDIGMEDDVVGLAVCSEADVQLRILPLWLDPAGLLVAGTEVRTRAAELHVHVTRPFPAASLAGTDSATVTQSVRTSSRSGRNAWRRIARSRPEGDGIRDAVVGGLQG